MNILAEGKEEINIKNFKGKVGAGGTRMCQRRVKNLKLLSTAMGMMPCPCEKADWQDFCSSRIHWKERGKSRLAVFGNSKPWKNYKTIGLDPSRIAPPLLVFSLPSHSFGRCGTPRPAFLSFHKFTSSSLKLRILSVPDCQTSHRGNRSEKSIHNMFLSIVFFANSSWDVCILEEWLFKGMIYLVGLSYAKKKIMIWCDCPKKEGCVNVNTKWSMKTYKFQSDSMGIRFLLEFPHRVLDS